MWAGPKKSPGWRPSAAPAICRRSSTVLNRVGDGEALATHTQFGSCILPTKPGDGSAREQALLPEGAGWVANICYQYATKRYRSNCINWGILPFTLGPDTAFDYEPGDCIFVPEVRQAVVQGKEEIPAKVIRQDGTVRELLLHLKGLTQNEKEIILDGCLMNYYAARTEE